MSAAPLDRAMVAARLGRPRLSAQLCEQALAGDPECARARALRLWAALELRDARGAAVLVREALARDPNSAWTHHAAGVLAQRAGQGVLAARHLRRAVLLAPGCARYRARFARAMAELGEGGVAIREGETSVELARRAQGGRRKSDPDDAPFGEVLGEVATAFARAGHLERACELARERLALEPEQPWAHVGYARALTAAGRFGEAARACDAALARAPNLAGVWALRAECYAALGFDEESARSREESARLRASVELTR